MYVTDAGQAQHFQMVFQAARKAGIVGNNHLNTEGSKGVELVHVPFGLVLGEDGKKIKSRAGDSVKLRDLLDEAVRRSEENEIARLEAQAAACVRNSSGVSSVRLESVRERAKVLGLGAVKYADLSMNRESNYRFSFDKMLSLTGNTAPYMVYAYVRVRGIQRRAAAEAARRNQTEGISQEELEARADITLSTAEEVALGKHLIKYNDVLTAVASDLQPHKVFCCLIFLLFTKLF